ncbi:MAG: hypothetical protein AAGJ34_02380 [Pseudomonadota bacterium]
MSVVFLVGSNTEEVLAEELFDGGSFTIAVPEGFIVEPALIHPTDPGVFESVHFHSPDGSMTFYVFAPKTGGAPADIVLKPDQEVMVSEMGEVVDGTSHTWWTIQDREKTYFRSYHSRSNLVGNDVLIFGVTYPDGKVLGAHKEQYIEFKKSFRRKADS